MNLQIDFSNLEPESVFLPCQPYYENGISLEERKVFYAYANKMYRKHRIWFKFFTELDLSRSARHIYFFDSGYLPYVKHVGYDVQAVSGISIIEYLKKIAIGTYVFISVKDDGSQALDEESTVELRKLGLISISKSNLRQSYIWVAKKITEEGFELIIHENCSPEQLLWRGICDGVDIRICSAGALSGNQSSITLDGHEYSGNKRGMNVVAYYPPTKSVTSVSFDTFVSLYKEGSLFHVTRKNPDPEVDARRLVSHAGGQIDGTDYSNCLQAMEFSYNSRNQRLFEIDFELTSDHHLVARHDWESYLYGHLKQTVPFDAVKDRPLSLRQFQQLKILEHYSPMTILEVLQFLSDRRDAYLITDTKYTHKDLVELQFRLMVEAAEKVGYEVLTRVIPQIYTEEMYEMIESIYPFASYIYTLYQTRSTDQEIIAFVNQNQIDAVTTNPARYNDKFGEELHKCGKKVYIHTINNMNEVQELLRKNVYGFYTDTLSMQEITTEIRIFEAEMKVQRQMLVHYLETRFHIQDDRIQEALSKLSIKSLEILSSKLFEIDSENEALRQLRFLIGPLNS